MCCGHRARGLRSLLRPVSACLAAMHSSTFDQPIILPINQSSYIFVASKLYGVNATIIIFVFVLYCILPINQLIISTTNYSLDLSTYHLTNQLTYHLTNQPTSFMPCLKFIFQNANATELRRLRGKTIECISLIGLAVGKEKVALGVVCGFVSLLVCLGLPLVEYGGLFWWLYRFISFILRFHSFIIEFHHKPTPPSHHYHHHHRQFMSDCNEVMQLLLHTQSANADLPDDDPQVLHGLLHLCLLSAPQLLVLAFINQIFKMLQLPHSTRDPATHTLSLPPPPFFTIASSHAQTSFNPIKDLPHPPSLPHTHHRLHFSTKLPHTHTSYRPPT